MNKFFFLTIMLLMVAAPNYTTSQNIGQKPRQNDSLIVAAKSEQCIMGDTLPSRGIILLFASPDLRRGNMLFE